MRRRGARMLLTGAAAALVLPLAGCASDSASSAGAADAETSGSVEADSASSDGDSVESTATDVVDSFSDGRSTAADSGGSSGSGEGLNSTGGGSDFPELAGVAVKEGEGASARVAFRFEDVGGKSELPSYRVKHLDGYPKAPGSGKPVEMAGQNFLGVTFTHATAAGELRESVEPELPTVAEVRYLGGFEKVQEAAIGVTSCHGAPTKQKYDVSKVDTAIVVTVQAADCSS
ncbi:AMIN-like domain-containing (lipo)protein [Actinopolyspora sp. H202]|uniref:AMIN-like domain-containing (lipo)protein n=1 Tax=Actinopolyspora sp. H202 TaxID=1500456 RepID=UPI003EE451E3